MHMEARLGFAEGKGAPRLWWFKREGNHLTVSQNSSVSLSRDICALVISDAETLPSQIFV